MRLNPNATGKQEIRFGKVVAGYPCTDSRSGLLRDFELHRSPGLPLNNHRTIADAAGGRYVSDRDRDQVATSKLAVDGEIEERQIPVSA